MLVTKHPESGSLQKRLISGSKDGLLKVWDLDLQTCLGTSGEQSMGKVNDFVLIGELGILVAASTDNALRIFSVEQSEEGAVALKFVSKLIKESGARVLQITFERKAKVLLVLNSDSTLELFKVNIDNPEAILKKLVRAEKKLIGAKRSHTEMEEEVEVV